MSTSHGEARALSGGVTRSVFTLRLSVSAFGLTTIIHYCCRLLYIITKISERRKKTEDMVDYSLHLLSPHLSGSISIKFLRSNNHKNFIHLKGTDRRAAGDERQVVPATYELYRMLVERARVVPSLHVSNGSRGSMRSFSRGVVVAVASSLLS